MLLRGYNRLLHSQLCLPRLSSSSKKGKVEELKAILSAPLERKFCCWTGQLNRMSRFQRMSVAMSLFLFRKVLPSEEPSIPQFLDKVSQPSPEPDAEFLEFAGKLVDKIFPEGWDSGYGDEVAYSSVGTSSCEEGGVTRERYLRKYGADARGTFVRVCLGNDPNWNFEPTRARMKSVFTAGKHRIVSIPSVDHHHLRPLHQLLYNHLSKEGWLLRGDAVPKRFCGKTAPFSKVDGEVFVSGDYEGATDNLNNHVQRFLLKRVLARCTHVPDSIKSYAVDSLSPTLSHNAREVKLLSGQMMGFLLSFPLLCLVNYVTFKFFVRRKVPVKVNGDDIVFRATRDEFEVWAAGVTRSGLKLSRGKTMVSATYFSLNSTLFKSRRSGEHVSQVPFIRSKALFGVEDGKISPFFSLRGRLSSFCVGFVDAARDVWMELFLKCNRGYIKRSRCSISRGLGYPLPKHVLQAANLWDRECSYLELPNEKPPSPPFSVWSHAPEGYEIAMSSEKYKYTETEKIQLRAAFADASWKPAKPEEEYERDIRGLRIPELNSKKFSRLAGVSFTEVRKMLSARRDKIYSQYIGTRVKHYQYWRVAAPRRDFARPIQATQDEGKTKDSVFYPPVASLYGMFIRDGYEPSSRVKHMKRKSMTVESFSESVRVRDRFGFVCPAHEYEDFRVFWE